jgi:outer membrane protein
MRKLLVSLIPVLGFFGAEIALAANTETKDFTESPWRLGVALGFGVRSNPLALSDNIPIIVDLDIGWFGEHWFFDNGDLGLMVLDRNHYTINLVGRFNSDRVFFGKTNSKLISVGDGIGPAEFEKIKIPDRDYAVELGVELLADGEWGYLQASAFGDVSGTHEGYELYADYSYPVRKQRWLYQPSLGASWKSKKLNDYYWGVRESETNSLFPVYTASSGLNLHARFMTSFQINRHWAFIAVAEYERLNPEAADSPIVEEQSVMGIFAGFKYEY